MAYTTYRYMVHVYQNEASAALFYHMIYEFLNVSIRGDDFAGFSLCLEIIVAVQP
jgi:hypothetical protein